MTFGPYPEYKPSGVEWLGDVPAHWDICALKRIVRLQSGESITSDAIEEMGDYPVYGGNGLRGYTSRHTHEGPHVLIGRQGALCGNVNYAFGKFWASEHAVVASPLAPTDLVWLGEMLRSMDLNQYSVSAAQPGLSVDAISRLLTARPPLAEQTAIGRFLQREISRIDALIAEQQRLIELLQEKRQAVISQAVTKGLDPNVPMKDSGVESLGRIPAHWAVKRLKHVTRAPLQYGANEAGDTDDPAYPRFVRITDVADDGRLRPETFRSLPPEVAAPYLLREGDVLLARSGATVGKTFIYSKGWGPACFAGYLIRATLNDAVCRATWFHAYCQTSNYWLYINTIQSQSTIPNVSAEKYGNIALPLPPDDEQARILRYIDSVSTSYEGTIAQARAAISLLGERRSALISAAVTGKINVT